MAADDILQSYRDTCQMPVAIRRYSGSPRTAQDYPAIGHHTLYSAEQLIGAIKQGDRRVIVIVQDLLDNGFSLPLTTNDKVVVEGKELAVMVPGERRALESDGSGKSILIAYEITARG